MTVESRWMTAPGTTDPGKLELRKKRTSQCQVGSNSIEGLQSVCMWRSSAIYTVQPVVFFGQKMNRNKCAILRQLRCDLRVEVADVTVIDWPPSEQLEL
jgi:hypothetical protein